MRGGYILRKKMWTQMLMILPLHLGFTRGMQMDAWFTHGSSHSAANGVKSSSCEESGLQYSGNAMKGFSSS